MKDTLKGELHQIRNAFRGLVFSGGLYLICLVISEAGVSAAPAAVINSQPAEQVTMTVRLENRDDITLSMLEEDLDALIDSDEIELSDGITLDEETQEALSDAVSELEEAGYSVSFVLEDLNTGAQLSYQPDVMYYAASSIKAFYVASLAADYPQVMNAEADAMMRVILYSDNDAYEYLRNTYGKEYIRDWCLKAGVRTDIAEEMYPDYTARELAKLWAVMQCGLRMMRSARQYHPGMNLRTIRSFIHITANLASLLVRRQDGSPITMTSKILRQPLTAVSSMNLAIRSCW